MSFTVSVAITVAQNDATYVSVVHGESVLPVSLGDPEAVTQEDVDLVDLVRAALVRIASEVVNTADTQVVQLRQLLEGLAS